MKIAFYKGHGRVYDKLVKWWTKGSYSHVEVLFSDGYSASASSRDGGIRFKKIKYNPERWDFVEVDCPEQEVQLWFTLRAGEKYDYIGLLGFLWRPISGRDKLWFCSEAIAASLGYKDSWRYCPNTLYSTLINK